jgi:hypothetical protein
MPRIIAIAVSAAAMLVCLPAQAQETELEGAPGYRAAEQETARKAEAQKKAAQAAQKPAQQQAQKPAQKPAQQQVQKQAQPAADKLKAEQAKLARQAEAQKAEQARLAKLAEDLKVEQARLDARAAELAEEKRRLLQERVDKASEAAKLAALDRQRDEAERDEDASDEGLRGDGLPSEDRPSERPGDRLPSIPPEPRRPAYVRLDYTAAERSCIRAAEDEALARDFYSARYDAAPRFYQNDGWELRGRVRLEDRRGYLLVNMVCEIGPNSEAMDVIFLR